MDIVVLGYAGALGVSQILEKKKEGGEETEKRFRYTG